MTKHLLSLLLLVVCTASITAQEPKLMLPIGHTGAVTSAVFSPDGKRVLTASKDETVKVWAAQTGKLLVDMKGHTHAVESALFSPDGKRVLTASEDNTSKIWNAQTGQLLVNLQGHTGAVESAVFSPDGKRVLTASKDETAKVWDAQNGQLLVEFKGHKGAVKSAVFSPDGKQVLTASRDNTVKIWDTQTGQRLIDLKGTPMKNAMRFMTQTGQRLIDLEGRNTSSFSPDGKQVLTASNNTAKIWDSQNGQLLVDFKEHTGTVESAVFSPDGKRVLITASSKKKTKIQDAQTRKRVLTAFRETTVKIWDAKTGKLLVDFKGHTGAVESAVFSPDGKRVLTGGKVWDALTGKLLISLKEHINDEFLTLFRHSQGVFSPDGQQVLTISEDNTAKVWNAQIGQLLVDLKGHTCTVGSAVFSPDGRRMLTADYKTAKIWDAQTGQLLLSLKRPTDLFPYVTSAVFSSDGKRILTASFEGRGKVWNALTGLLLVELNRYTGLDPSAIFDRDGERVLTTTSWEKTAMVFDAQTGQLLVELKEIKRAVLSPDGQRVLTASGDTATIWDAQTGELLVALKAHKSSINSAVFSPDGQRVLTAYRDTATIWDAQTGQLLIDLKIHESSINSAVFSPDGQRVLTASGDTATIWDAQTGQLLVALEEHTGAFDSPIFSSNGKRILRASSDKTARIWDAQTGKQLIDLKGHTGLVHSAVFSPDSKHILTASQDHTSKLWNAENGELLYTFMAIDSTDYLVVDKDGRYDGTENARKLIYYVCNDEVIELEQVKDLAWEPDLVAKIMGVNPDPIRAKGLPVDICGRLPKIEEKGKKQGFYYFRIQPGTGGVGEVRLYVNGKHIGQPRSVKDLPLRNGGYEIAIPEAEVAPYLVKDFDNQVYIRAKTADNSLISRGPIEPQVSSSTMTLNPDTHIYILSVGISQFKNPTLNLRYSSKDAVDFGKAMKNSATAWVGAAKTHLYLLHSEAANPAERPEKNNIVKAMAEIDRQTTANDLVLCFLSGHGAKSNLGEFYFLNPQASQFDIAGVEKNIGISRTEIQDWLRKITAKNQVLILDACNSADVALANTKDLSSEHIKALDDLRGNTGSYVLTASSGAAYESSVYNQGLLTYGLLWGIKTGAAAPNGLLRVNTMFGEAIKQTRLLAQNIGGMQDPKLLGNGDIAIGVVNETVQKEIVLAKAKPVVSRSSFSLKASKSDKERFSYLADQVLKELSQRISESNYVFVADVTANPQAAYSLRGEYQVQGNELTITYELYQGEEAATQFPPLKGPLDQKEALAKEMVEKLRGYLEEKNPNKK